MRVSLWKRSWGGERDIELSFLFCEEATRRLRQEVGIETVRLAKVVVTWDRV
jgi:hypothetical protein